MLLKYGGRLNRLVAFVIDFIIMFLVEWALNFLILRINTMPLYLAWAIYLVDLLVVLLYTVVFQARNGQTVGKQLMKIRVVDGEGKAPSLLIFFIREVLGKFSSSLIFGIGYLMILWDKKRQGLHDKIADTYVVKVE